MLRRSCPRRRHKYARAPARSSRIPPRGQSSASREFLNKRVGAGTARTGAIRGLLEGISSARSLTSLERSRNKFIPFRGDRPLVYLVVGVLAAIVARMRPSPFPSNPLNSTPRGPALRQGPLPAARQFYTSPNPCRWQMAPTTPASSRRWLVDAQRGKTMHTATSCRPCRHGYGPVGRLLFSLLPRRQLPS
jgi:hypothetical protein